MSRKGEAGSAEGLGAVLLGATRFPDTGALSALGLAKTLGGGGSFCGCGGVGFASTAALYDPCWLAAFGVGFSRCPCFPDGRTTAVGFPCFSLSQFCLRP